MVELNEEGQPSAGLGPDSLAHVCRLPIEFRTRRILDLGQNDIAAALCTLRAKGALLPSSLDAERLAWTIAFNIEGGNLGVDSGGSPSRGLKGYGARWAPGQPWTAVWSELITPLANANTGNTTLLTELALSVEC